MFDYENNPAGYRLCQDEAAKIGGIELLLQQAISGKDDALRSQSLEAVARMSFGNPATVELAAGAAETLQAICTALQSGAVPEKLSALQLAQTVAASSSPNAVAMVPQLVPEAAALLSENFGFDQLSRGALDFLVSSSFTHPHAVVGALGWQQIIDLLSEDRRPAWLHAGPLETFICGLLATNCLEAASGEADASHEIVGHMTFKNIPKGIKDVQFQYGSHACCVQHTQSYSKVTLDLKNLPNAAKCSTGTSLFSAFLVSVAFAISWRS